MIIEKYRICDSPTVLICRSISVYKSTFQKEQIGVKVCR